MVRMAAALFSAQMTTWLVTVIGLFVTARYLGANDFGVLTTAGTVGGFTLTLASLGTTNYLIKGVSRSPATSPQLVIVALVLRLVAWVVVLAVLVPATFVLIEDPIVRWALVVLVIGAGFDLVKTATSTALQAHYALGRVAIAQGLVALAIQGVIVLLLVSGYGLRTVVIGLAASAGLTALGTLVYYWRRFGAEVAITGSALRQVLTGSAPYLAWDTALLILGGADVLMLAVMSGPSMAGFYGLALRLSAVSAFVYVILSGTVFPSLSAAGPGNPAYVRALLSRAIHLLLVATLPIATGIALLAGEITTFIGGADFAPATPVVLIMAGVVPLIGLDTLLGTALFAVDRQKVWIYIAWGAAVLNITMNLIAIPLADALWSNAAIGAAITTLLTELLMGASAWILLGKYRDARAARSTFVRAALACLVMAGPVFLAREQGGLFLAVPVGVAVYAAAVVLLKLVSMEDVRLVRGAMRGG